MLKDQILSKYPNAKIEGRGAMGITGEFEITLNGFLIHSKENGDGMPNFDEILKKINNC